MTFKSRLDPGDCLEKITRDVRDVTSVRDLSVNSDGRNGYYVEVQHRDGESYRVDIKQDSRDGSHVSVHQISGNHTGYSQDIEDRLHRHG